MKKYLGLDLGSKTLGVSISLSGVIASNLETLRFKNDDYNQAIDLLIPIIKTHGIDVVVLGVPKHMNNDLGIRGQISHDFKAKILEKMTCEVVLWDERMSTQTAIKTMIKANESRKKQKQKKDELAATIILQNYLDYKENLK